MGSLRHGKNHGSFDGLGHARHVVIGTGGSGHPLLAAVREGTRQPLAEHFVLLQLHRTAEELQCPRSPQSHTSRISSRPKSPFPRSQESEDVYGCTKYWTLSGDLPSLARQRCMATGICPPPPHCPKACEQGTRIAAITHPPARQLRHFSEHAVALSLVEDRRLRAGNPELPC